MLYSIAPILAFLVSAVINYDFFLKVKDTRTMTAYRSYRFFLFTTAIFFVVDALWGIFDSFHLTIFNQINTFLFFASMGAMLLLWTIFIVEYLNDRNILGKVLIVSGLIFFLAFIAVLVINIFVPGLIFKFVDDKYIEGMGRNIFLISQAVLFFLTSLFVLISSINSKDNKKRRRQITIGVFGVVMAIAISIQVPLPFFPIYSCGLLFGISLVQTFVTADEKNDYREALEAGLYREKKQQEELGSARELVYVDSLTGTKSKHAYVELEEKVDKDIASGAIEQFSIIVFDLNDLKYINDNLGHEEGDNYLKAAATLIKTYFPDSPIFRFGGDEFVSVLEGEQYHKRHDLLHKFDKKIDDNFLTSEPIIATGISDFRYGKDNTFRAVFARADERMYSRKAKLKEKGTIDLNKFRKNKVEGVEYKNHLLTEMAKYMRYRRDETNPRFRFYKNFYKNEDYPLIDLLNNSSCDEILEINIEKDTFKQFYHVDGKYFVPPLDYSYKKLQDFVIKHIVHPEDVDIYQKMMKKEGIFERLADSPIPNFNCAQFRYKLQDGSYRYVEQCIIAGEENGIPQGIIRVYIFDIQNLKARQLGIVDNENNVISKQRDSVTNLLVEKDFVIRSQEYIDNNPNIQYCLISMDIEHFKFFDEWYGREMGDLLLAKIGATLSENEEALNGVSGYFGKDDFALLIPFDRKEIERIYEEIRHIIISFGLSVGFIPAFGVALIEKDMSVVDAFDRATIASSRAKTDIRNRICIYDAEMQFLAIREHRLLSEFMQALKNDEITFYLQPQARISSHKIVGAESLARWIKKDGTMVRPDEFVPVLEKYGFISDLDTYLWEKVCQWLRKWIDDGHKPVPISLNVSRADIFTIDIAEYFINLVDKYKLQPDLIKIEITESSYAETKEAIGELVKKLRSNGFRVLMDDFGTGYSSLNMLSNLKIDAIKLDASFLNLVDDDNEKGMNIIESIVNMTKLIALPIIVEGVENKNQCDYIEKLGCRYIQGYFFYKPMPVKDFEKIISDEEQIDDRGFVVKLNEQFRIREFLDVNVYSDSMLNNVLGAVAIYSWKNNQTDIVRFNQQFYESVNVPDFSERLTNIERFLYKGDAEKMYIAFKEAIDDKLNGSNAILRFFRTDGSLTWYNIHFYYLGKKEDGDRFYGSAENITEIMNLKEQHLLISKYAMDNIIFVTKTDNKWVYNVVSHGLSDVFGLSPVELEKEMNNGQFAKRVIDQSDLAKFMKECAERTEKKENFEKDFVVLDKNNNQVKIHLEFTYAGEDVTFPTYILRSSKKSD